VFLKSIGGLTVLNDNDGSINAGTPSIVNATVHPVGATTASTFDLADEGPTTVGYTAYTSGGTAYCVKSGCSRVYFPSLARNGWGWTATGYSFYYPNTNCVTERTGTDAYDDTAFGSGAYTGIHYTDDNTTQYVGDDCVSQAIQPLTSDKTTLTNLANALNASGSTAGQIGLAWGWYMLNPNLSSFWPIAPAAYGSSNLIKAVVLMTDGVFNSQYCNGVVTQEDPADGVTSSGAFSTCAPNNGYSKVQAQALCNAINATSNHTLLYTVGFDLGSDTVSLNFLKGCATPSATDKYFIQADDNAALQAAFEEIARQLNNLRLSK
jgi:hypothetical protein